LSDDVARPHGWSTELGFLLARHPRPAWPARHSPTVEFWLGVHERLRRDCAGIRAATDDYGSERLSAAQLAVVATPRLRGLVAAMHGHHQIEDFQYFPAFRRAEPRLGRGFELLETEHADLRADIDAAVAALAELRTAAERATHANAAATLALGAQRYTERAERLCARLVRHLGDEEDLVVPLLLEHGDL
jgi:hypothetical protein